MTGAIAGSTPSINSPLEAEAKCEIRVQFLTFSCTKFFYFMNTGAQLGQFLYKQLKKSLSRQQGVWGSNWGKCAQVYDACPAL